MKSTAAHPNRPRIHTLGAEILGPVRAPQGTARRRILLARSAVAYGGLVMTLVQIVVWLMIGVLSGHLDTPWWLWTTVPAGVVVVGLTAVERWRAWWISAATTHSTADNTDNAHIQEISS
jgi:hypothetical protein